MLLLLLFPGKRVETIQKHLQQVFTEGAWHQPAVVLLDDLDQVISAPSPTQEIGGEALYKLRLAEGETFRTKSETQRALEGLQQVRQLRSQRYLQDMFGYFYILLSSQSISHSFLHTATSAWPCKLLFQPFL